MTSCSPAASVAAIVPSELHVKLFREDEPLLGFELLAARRAEAQGKATPEQRSSQ